MGPEGDRFLIVEREENASPGVIEIRAWRSNEVFVAVEDNGIGIDPAMLERIFDAFYSTKPATGTGFGLGVVRKLVTLYDGAISVESTVGEGTTFTVSLSSSPDEAPVSAATEHAESLAGEVR